MCKTLSIFPFSNLVRARSVSINIRARNGETRLTLGATQLMDHRNFVRIKIPLKRMEPFFSTIKVCLFTLIVSF